MEMICDSGKDGLARGGGGEPRDRRSEPHGRSGRRAGHVGIGKANSMKLRVAVLYGGRSGEHEVSINSAKAIMQRMDPAKYEIIEYFIDKQGQWKPRPILPEPGAQPEIDVVFPVLHGTFGEDGTVQGLLELADLPYVGAGVLASSVSMDKEMMKRVCHGTDVAGCRLRDGDARESGRRGSLRAPAVPDVRQAGQPGLVGGHFQSARSEGTGGRRGAGRAIRPQDRRRARHRGP